MKLFIASGTKAVSAVAMASCILIATVGATIETPPVQQSTVQLGLPAGAQFRVVPAEDSQFRNADVFVSQGSDGKVHVVTRPQRPDLPIWRQSLYFAVDVRQRMYRAAVMTTSPTVNALRITRILDAFGRAEDIDPTLIREQAQARADFLNKFQPTLIEMWLPPCQECDVDNCFGYADSWLETYDPAEIKLTETESLVFWEAQDTGTKCIWDIDVDYDCWAANPSSAGTHWFTSSCVGAVEDEWFYGGETRVGGNYYNDDFGSNSLRTWVDTEIYTFIDEGTATDIDFTWIAYGEWSGFLHYHWDEDAANGCW